MTNDDLYLVNQELTMYADAMQRLRSYSQVLDITAVCSAELFGIWCRYTGTFDAPYLVWSETTWVCSQFLTFWILYLSQYKSRKGIASTAGRNQKVTTSLLFLLICGHITQPQGTHSSKALEFKDFYKITTHILTRHSSTLWVKSTCIQKFTVALVSRPN